MSEAEEKLRNQALNQLEKAGVSTINQEKLETSVARLKSIAGNKDAALVTGTDENELETVRINFVVKHCGEGDKSKGAAAVSAVASKMGEAGTKMKNRAAFYYMVKQKLG